MTCTINQADSEYATGLAKEYKPRSVAEMSAFVAILRPGCKSLLDGFIHREPYTTGVEALDAILEDSGHRLIYQESIMKYLIWLSIKESGTYDIIKKIAKKKFKAPELEALKEKLKASWIDQVGTIDGFEETWIVIEQAAKYSFNASHSLSYAYDSLYGAYLKSHYPLDYYTVAFNFYDGDLARTRNLSLELKYFGIKLNPPRFRHSISEYRCDKEEKVIYKGLHSIKYLNSEVADGLYSLRDNQYRNFIDFLYDARSKVKVDYRQLGILIQLEFFEEFGDVNSLLVQLGLFREIHDKKQLKKDKLVKTVVMKKEDVNGETVEKTFDVEIPIAIASECCSKETEKQFSGIDMKKLLEKVCENIEVPKAKVKDKVNAQKEYLGYIDIMEDQYSGMAYVEEINSKYTPRLELYSLKNGTSLSCKISKQIFNRNKLVVGDVIYISSTDYKPKSRKLESGGYEEVPGTKELWVTRYEKVAI